MLVNGNAVSSSVRGHVGEDARSYAIDKVGKLAGSLPEPVLFTELKLLHEPSPANERPAQIEAVLDVNGRLIRAHVAASDMFAAADLVVDRLQRRLARFATTRSDLRRRGGATEPAPHEWRHGDLPTHRPRTFDRPPDEREILRRKTFAIDPLSPDEAADMLDLLGHDFVLFGNVVTGADAVLAYGEDGLVLGDSSDAPDAIGQTTVTSMVQSRVVAPRCTIADAIERLDLDLEPFVFFVDAATGRGNVVYRRYDGHYGLISPAA